jgi:hypothetical protein
MLQHIEKHWLKYYLGTGIVVYGYDLITSPGGISGFSLVPAVVTTLTWPIQVLGMVQHAIMPTSLPSAPPAA